MISTRCSAQCGRRTDRHKGLASTNIHTSLLIDGGAVHALLEMEPELVKRLRQKDVARYIEIDSVSLCRIQNRRRLGLQRKEVE